MSPLALDILGYIASGLVALSLTMSNVVKLRWINLAGALVFTVYGILIDAYPVAVVNGFISIVNVRYLWVYHKQRERYDLLGADEASGLLTRFVERYRDDIRSYFPGAGWPVGTGERPQGVEGALILRDLTPAGLIVWRQVDGAIEVLIDYASPEYRDHKSAKFLYRQLGERWRGQGALHVFAEPKDDSIASYLVKAGFHRADDGRFERSL